MVIPMQWHLHRKPIAVSINETEAARQCFIQQLHTGEPLLSLLLLCTVYVRRPCCILQNQLENAQTNIIIKHTALKFVFRFQVVYFSWVAHRHRKVILTCCQFKVPTLITMECQAYLSSGYYDIVTVWDWYKVCYDITYQSSNRYLGRGISNRVLLYNQSSLQHCSQLILRAVDCSIWWPPPLLWVPAIQQPCIVGVYHCRLASLNALDSN